MAPWLPPIVVYCPPAQQCSAVAPPAPPRPHPRLRPVPSPLPLPPLLPPAPSSPQGFPRHQFVGEKGGAHGGCALGSLLLGGRGGASVACVMGPPTCAILGRVSRLELARPCAPLARRSWHRAGKTRPARTSGTECHPALCAPNCLSCGRPARRQSSGTPGNGIPACASSTGGRAGAPRAAHSFAAFPLCIALPQLLHSPMVAPWLRRGASLCSGGAAQAPQQVKPEKTPVCPSDCHGNRA